MWTEHCCGILRRITQLYVGLALYGFSMALMVRSGSGVIPWDVLHQGLSLKTGISMGSITVIVGVLVLLMWLPLRERPGLGTVSNVLVIGPVLDASLAILPSVTAWWAHASFVIAGVLLNSVATAGYIGVQLGAGPRDGLMTGLVHRTGSSIKRVRTAIEIVVVIVGWSLGGTFGIGTVVYALTIGPMTQFFLRHLTIWTSDQRLEKFAER